MKLRRIAPSCRVVAVVSIVAGAAGLHAQTTAGRVFCPTDETVAIWELNEFPDLVDGSPLTEGSTIPDLSGRGLDATVEVNTGGDLKVGPGDPTFDAPPGANRECQRTTFSGHAVRIAVNDDGDAFEMAPDADFSVELYVDREIVDGGENWGILAGTWHSRNLLDDLVGTPDADGAWYGFGLIRNDKVSNPPAEWSWVLSPVVDGVPRLGFDEDPEQHLNPFFDIPEGRHYVVLSVDRVAQTATGYVDGIQVTQRFVDPTWSFTTPDGYEHARFLMFSGEDDPTRGVFRGSPAGTHLDAVRVQRKAVSAEEVQETWDNILSGAPSPVCVDRIRASVVVSTKSALVNQCVRVSGEGSYPGPGRTITKYEWQVAGGPFEERGASWEVSFDAPNAAGYEIVLRITNDAAEQSLARVQVAVQHPPIAARIQVSLGGAPVVGRPLIIIPRGAVLTLDGAASGAIVPATALTCPTANNVPVEPLPITSYRWDLDGRPITVEDTRPVFDTTPFATLGEFPVTLSVRNDVGQQASATLRLKVVDAGRNSQVFGNTPDTLVHFEFNGLPETPNGTPLSTGQEFEDLSGNDYRAVVESNEPADLTLGAGSPIYDTPAGNSREIQRHTFAGHQARLAINEDGDAFEMAPEDDFSVELFVDREVVDGGENWGILAGTWHSRNLLDDFAGAPDADGAWYGFGLIRNDKASNPPYEWSWVLSPVVDGVPRLGFDENPEQHLNPFFDIPEGRHYVVLSVDRIGQLATGYVDGTQVAQRTLDPTWSFTTPDGYEHARFLMFSGEDDPTRTAYRGSPAGTHLDAVRVQRVALAAEEVASNWGKICAGDGTEPPTTATENCTNGADDDSDGKTDCEDPDCAAAPSCQSEICANVLDDDGDQLIDCSDPDCASDPICPPAGGFHRGDSNNDGKHNISDPVNTLNVLFLGSGAIPCQDAADSNDDGKVNISDPVNSLNVLFLGTGAVPPPLPPEALQPCGPDPTVDLPSELGCVTYTNC